jgi:catechol 2,3-dioxygenase-like lactoylglutathione lyase family enzyme
MFFCRRPRDLLRTQEAPVATLDHIILKVNDLDISLAFYTDVLGFTAVGKDGPFTVLQAGTDFQIQIAPWGTPGFEHYAFAVSNAEFDAIFDRIKAAGIPFGPTFDSVGVNSGPGNESGARGPAPTLYFNDPNKHLLEIRTYER